MGSIFDCNAMEVRSRRDYLKEQGELELWQRKNEEIVWNVLPIVICWVAPAIGVALALRLQRI